MMKSSGFKLEVTSGDRKRSLTKRRVGLENSMIEPRSILNRRDFLQRTGAGFLSLSLSSELVVFGGDKPLATWVPLGALAAKKNILFGFALNHSLLSTNADYDALVARECTIVTPENAMKWEAMHPARDQYSFTQADAIVAFAETQLTKNIPEHPRTSSHRGSSGV
jgi:hypothetical protein